MKHLDATYAQLLREPPRENNSGLPQTETIPLHTASITSTGSQSEVLDLATVMKSSQALSSEIQLETLLKKMMRIVLENAGAQKGMLLLEQQGGYKQWLIEAKGDVDEKETIVLQSIPLSDELLPISIIQYVIHSHEPLLINDTGQDGQFNSDPYIVQHHPKSILCSPILHQRKLTGIAYLENKLSAGVFTPERLKVLRMLSSQVAISIENARLYGNLEHLAEERTRDLSNALENLKTTQSQLVESEKMASLGALVAGVAHEINTPLGVGVTAASNLHAEVEEFMEAYRGGSIKKSQLNEFTEIVQESSDILLSNLQRSAELVQSFKKVAVDRSSETKQRFKVKEYLEEVLRSLHPQLKKTQHHIEIICDEDFSMDSYPGEFSQIVTNLVMNSVKHAYDDGDAGKMVFEITQKERQPAGVPLKMVYRDDGKGIPPENLGKIFDPFFTTKRGKGGTGLGLHIVYNIITQKLKGTIKCESKVGAGTQFIIELIIK